MAKFISCFWPSIGFFTLWFSSFFWLELSPIHFVIDDYTIEYMVAMCALLAVIIRLDQNRWRQRERE